MILARSCLAVVIIWMIGFFWPVTRLMRLLVRNLDRNFMALLLIALSAMLLGYFVTLWYFDVLAMLVRDLVNFWYLYVMAFLLGYLVTFFSIIIARLAMLLIMSDTLLFVNIGRLRFVLLNAVLFLLIITMLLVMYFTMRDLNFLANSFVFMFIVCCVI